MTDQEKALKLLRNAMRRLSGKEISFLEAVAEGWIDLDTEAPKEFKDDARSYRCHLNHLCTEFAEYLKDV